MSSKQTICYHIKASWHVISRMYNSYASDEGLTITMGYVLIYLDTERGIPSTQIGPKLGMEARSLTRLLKSLEEKGLIRRETDLNDRRQVNIFLTDEGKVQQKEAKQTVKTFNNMIKDEIEAGDIATFLTVLERIQGITEKFNLQKTI